MNYYENPLQADACAVFPLCILLTLAVFILCKSNCTSVMDVDATLSIQVQPTTLRLLKCGKKKITLVVVIKSVNICNNWKKKTFVFFPSVHFRSCTFSLLHEQEEGVESKLLFGFILIFFNRSIHTFTAAQDVNVCATSANQGRGRCRLPLEQPRFDIQDHLKALCARN